MDRVWVNGVEQPWISACDRGLQYGDGLFETMAVLDGKVRHIELHYERLRLGCERLGLPCPEAAGWHAEMATAASRAGSRAVLKLIVTRGAGPRGYAAPEGIEPTRIVSLHSWPGFPAGRADDGVTVRWCTTRLAEQPLLAGIKHLNRLEQVLARREWSAPDIAEGLLCDTRGRLVGGTMSNVFLVKGEALSTPRLDRCGVDGTMRRAVMRAAERAGLEVRETELSPADLARADEAFLTNALIGIWPVKRIVGAPGSPREERSLPVGPVTRTLQRLVLARRD